jgi:hypothetical protein
MFVLALLACVVMMIVSGAVVCILTYLEKDKK